MGLPEDDRSMCDMYWCGSCETLCMMFDMSTWNEKGKLI